MSGLTPPVNFNLFQKTIVGEIKRSLGLVAITDSPVVQQAPRPHLPYVSFNFTTPSAKYGFDSVSLESGDSIYNVGGQRRMTVSFQVYAATQPQAWNIMTTWQAALEMPSVQNRFRAAGIPVWSSGVVADLSQLLNTGWEGRAQLDAFFGFASNVTDDLGEIESAQVEATIQAGLDEKEVDFDCP